MLSFPSAIHIPKKPSLQDQIPLLSNRLLPLYTSHNHHLSSDGSTPLFMSKSRPNNLNQESVKYLAPPPTSKIAWQLPKNQTTSTPGPTKKLYGFNLDCSFPQRPRHAGKSDKASYNVSMRNLKKTIHDNELSSLLNSGAVTERKAQAAFSPKDFQLANVILHVPSKSVDKLKEYTEKPVNVSIDNRELYQRSLKPSANVSSNDSSNHYMSSSQIQYTDEILIDDPQAVVRTEPEEKRTLLRHIAHASISCARDQKVSPVMSHNIIREPALYNPKTSGFPSDFMIDEHRRKREIYIEDDNVSALSQKIRIRDILSHHQVNFSHGLSSKNTNKPENNILIMQEASKEQFLNKRELLPGLKLSQMRKSIQSQRNGSLSGESSLKVSHLQAKSPAEPSSLEEITESSQTVRTMGDETLKNKPILRQRPVRVKKSSTYVENLGSQSARKCVTFKTRMSRDVADVVKRLGQTDENTEFKREKKCGEKENAKEFNIVNTSTDFSRD